MRFSTVLSLSLTLFTTAITAIAFPANSDDCSSCGTLITSTNSCGYNMLDDTTAQPTDSQWSCMCRADGFVNQYGDCMSCLESLGQVSSSAEKEATTSVKKACEQLNGNGAGSLAVGPGKIVAGALAVGLGMYAL